MSVMKTTLLSLALLSTALMAQSGEEAIPTVDGYVYIDSANAKKAYEEWHYSPARSSGDLVFFSGVIAGAPVEGATPELFKKNLRRAFGNLNTLLK
jgi:enamine deaminase RidA (YjgF/YER057c/UK114 family)